jgi:RND family efflux transporter MFP subunit
MTRLFSLVRRRRSAFLTTGTLVVLAVAGFMVSTRGGSLPNLPMAEVTAGDFVDTIEIRGEIRPVKSVVLTSPLQSGELQIVKLARNGTMVKAGDVVVQFDGSTLQRTIQEKQSELKQADAEIEQTMAQGRITAEQNATALMKAKYDIERAKLDVDRGETVSRIDNEKARLVLADAEQKLIEIEEKIKSDKAAAEADVFAKRRKREKALYDLQRARVGLENLEVKAPAAGMVNILPNYRSGSMFGGEQEFREGDRAWPGAAILELPDLSSVHLEARLDESDRGRLKEGQDASVRIEAVPGRDFKAKIDRISLLARVDFASGWPPPRNFDLGLVLLEGDPRIRPGMTAVARIATERVPGVTLIPTEAIFQKDGSPIVYRLSGTEFEERRIEVSRRGREQAVVTSGVSRGDRVATSRPPADLVRRTP